MFPKIISTKAGPFGCGKQQGLGLPAAIFVITLLAIIAVAINDLLSQNANTFAEDVSYTRAFYAAESGANFAENHLFPPDDYPGYGAGGACWGGTKTYTFSADGLNQCTAQVTCETVTVSATNYFTIVSKGPCNDVSRAIQVRSSL